MLGPDRTLLFYCARIAVAGIIPLVSRQRGRSRRCAVVPTVPPASTLFPVAPPAIPPTGRRVGTPVAEIRRRLAVVANRDTKNINRHIVITHPIPWPVVPAARIPVIAPEHPVEAIVKEVIRIHSGRVVNRIARNPHKIRIRRIMDTDADIRISRAIAGWLVGGRGRATLDKGHRYRNQQVSFFHLLLLPQMRGHRFGVRVLMQDLPPGSDLERPGHHRPSTRAVWTRSVSAGFQTRAQLLRNVTASPIRADDGRWTNLSSTAKCGFARPDPVSPSTTSSLSIPRRTGDRAQIPQGSRRERTRGQQAKPG